MSDLEPRDREAEIARQRELRRKQTRLRNASRVLFCVFLGIFLISSWMLIERKWTAWKSEQTFNELNSLLDTTPIGTDPIPTASGQQDHHGAPEESGAPVHPRYDENGVLIRYSKIYARNPDFYGWITIPGTVVDYPVMRTPEDEEYYLRRDFDGHSNRNGVPFVDVDCTEEGMNWIVYGHNMWNGDMFHSVEAYKSEDFWKEHPVIHFDTIHEEGTYEVMAAFFTRVFYQYETDVFRYYNYDDLSDAKDYEDYVSWMKSHSLYDTGVEAEYGDDLLTLITCKTYGEENDRFVVVARKCE